MKKGLMNDIWGYNIANDTWYKIQATTTPGWPLPHERQGHKVALSDDIMYMFGGYYDPVRYFQDTWHYNITASMWVPKHIDGRIPTARSSYAMALHDQVAIFFGGYGSKCELIETGASVPEEPDPTSHSHGLYCEPRGTAFYLGDTWHYNMNICPRNCKGNGTCHFGSCICGMGTFGLDCSNRTCPDCPIKDPKDPNSLPCELWDTNDESRTWDPWGTAPPLGEIRGNPSHYYAKGGWKLPHIDAHSSRAIQLYTWAKPLGTEVELDNNTHLSHRADLGRSVYDEGMDSNFDCSYKACPHPTCNGGGKCLLKGFCVCHYSIFEKDCSISFKCPHAYKMDAEGMAECSHQGICMPGGICKCYDGFTGADCAVAVFVSSAGRLYVPSLLGMFVMLVLCFRDQLWG